MRLPTSLTSAPYTVMRASFSGPEASSVTELRASSVQLVR
jgi:hypothetical protein